MNFHFGFLDEFEKIAMFRSTSVAGNFLRPDLGGTLKRTEFGTGVVRKGLAKLGQMSGTPMTSGQLPMPKRSPFKEGLRQAANQTLFNPQKATVGVPAPPTG